MKFQVVHDMLRQRVVLYCELGTDEQTGERHFLTRRTGEHRAEEVHKVSMGDEPPIWDWFPVEAVKPLAEALTPHPVASERHLEDALATRDRVFRLHEALLMAQLAPADADHLRSGDDD
jgi:hypothetical protein